MARLKVSTDADESMPLDMAGGEAFVQVIEKKVWRLRSLFETDLKTAFKYLDDLRDHEAWKYLKEESMESLVENRCRVAPAFVEQLRSGYESLVSAGHRGKVTATQAILKRRELHPNEPQGATAAAVGCSQGLVSQVISKSSESEQKVIVPSWVTSKDDRAAFRKLPPEEQEKLAKLNEGERRGAVRQAAIAAGIIKVPSVLEKLLKLWEKATADERSAFLKKAIKDDEPCTPTNKTS